MGRYKIVKKIIDLQFSIEYLETALFDFSYQGEAVTNMIFQLIEITDYNILMDDMRLDNKYLMKSEIMSIIKIINGYKIIYSDNSKVKGCRIDCDEWKVDIEIDSTMVTDEMRQEISIAIRDAFFVYLSFCGYMAIHSSTIIYNEKAYLFSASSGIGKTTHTKMWEELYQVPILNGDVTVIGFEDGTPIAYGIPWCGTSLRYLNKQVSIGGIIFLKQAKENAIEDLPLKIAVKMLVGRSFNPYWDKYLADKNYQMAFFFAKAVPCYTLMCLPEQKAVITVKKILDI